MPHTLKRLFKAPAFTVATILCLSVGVGATLTVFNLVNALFLRTLPVSEPNRLVAIEWHDSENQELQMSYPMFAALRAERQVFSGVFAWWDALFSVQQNDGNQLHVLNVTAVSEDYFSTLGIIPEIGRPLTTGSNPDDAVISYSLWQRWYGGSPAAVGKVLKIEGSPFTVIGVLPKRFSGLRVGTAADVTIPLSGISLFTGKRDGNFRARFENRKAFWLSVMARLANGVSAGRAQSKLDTRWSGIMARELPTDFSSPRKSAVLHSRAIIQLASTGFSFLRTQFSQALFILAGLTLILLLFTCTNIANLMVARAASRAHETGICIALGAKRRALILNCFSEAMSIAAAATLLGIAISYWASRGLATFVWRGNAPLSLDLRPNLTVLLVAAALAITVAASLTAFTAWLIIHYDARTLLSQRYAGMHIGPGVALRKVLMGIQLAVSCVLLVGALLFSRSLRSLMSVNPGFRTDGLVVAQLVPRPGGYQGIDLSHYYESLLTLMSGQPGIVSVSLSNLQPMGFEWREFISVPGQAVTRTHFATVTPGFLETLGIPILYGRDFTFNDGRESPRVAIISKSLAERLFPRATAVGQRFSLTENGHEQELEVVGIAADANLWNIRLSRPFTLYVSFFQEPHLMGRPVLEAHVQIAPHLVMPRISKELDSLGREYVFRSETISELLSDALVEEEALRQISRVVAAFALMIAFIGIYGLISYIVTAQTANIGIRMALGASKSNVIRWILRDVIKFALFGISIGLPAAFVLSRFVRGFLSGFSTTDPISYAVAGPGLLLFAIAAAAIPAWRASSVEPLAALRMQ